MLGLIFAFTGSIIWSSIGVLVVHGSVLTMGGIGILICYPFVLGVICNFDFM